MELWDAYDEHLCKLDLPPLVRGEPIPEGVYHLSCEILVKHTDGTYLVMQRDWNKPHFAGMWEATAGGAALVGESPADCAMRELTEETGVTPIGLTHVGTQVRHEYHRISCQFLCITDMEKDKVILQEGETIAYRWLSKLELLAESDSIAAKRTLKYVD